MQRRLTELGARLSTGYLQAQQQVQILSILGRCFMFSRMRLRDAGFDSLIRPGLIYLQVALNEELSGFSSMPRMFTVARNVSSSARISAPDEVVGASSSTLSVMQPVLPNYDQGQSRFPCPYTGNYQHFLLTFNFI